MPTRAPVLSSPGDAGGSVAEDVADDVTEDAIEEVGVGREGKSPSCQRTTMGK
jgi:hypothetical protein